MYRIFFLLSSILFINPLCGLSQHNKIPTRQDTLKGSITPERAWWDVLHYDLTLRLDLERKSLEGKNIIDFEVVSSSQRMQIDLQEPLRIDSILLKDNPLPFTKDGSAWYVETPKLSFGRYQIEVYYSGFPKESVNPPYDGGIVWALDSLDRPWVSVACQLVGGSVWYPCKDHYSEKPENGVTTTLLVPGDLIAISNGRLASKQTKDGLTEFKWTVSLPINNYGVSFYIGNYVELKNQYQGINGRPLDMTYWVLDYNQSKIENYMIQEVEKTMEAFEAWFGPYPFYEDGFQIIESPYIGMEHQSGIAYGNRFKRGRFGFKNLSDLNFKTDRLIVHEMAHEWYGNNITMSDMADRWVQEGFAAFSEELMMEYYFGRETGRNFYLTRQKNFIKNQYPLISRYGIFEDAGPDMYFKGWAICHMLREIVNNDELFKKMLIEMNQELKHSTIYSEQLEKYISDFTSINFTPFFDQYLREAEIPFFEYRIEDSRLFYRLNSTVENLYIPINIDSPRKMRVTASPSWQDIYIEGLDEDSSIELDPNYLIKILKIDE